jgi:hypothetical protein
LRTVLDVGAVKEGRPEIKIPNTEKVVQATFLDGTKPDESTSQNGPTVLANWVATRENPFFARAAVDHLWTYFFGVSLLEPIQEGPEGAITHPDLLNMMAKEFADHNFDLQYLTRAIVYSKTYGRSSKPATNTPEASALFAHMPVRSLSAEQLFDSFCQATFYIEQNNPNRNPQLDAFNGVTTPRGSFIQKFAEKGSRTEKQTSILQALFLMNNKFVHDRIDPKYNEKFAVLCAPDYDPTQAVETLYLMVLSRPATEREANQLIPYVQRGGPTGDRARALTDIYWALLNSSEFMLNH